MAPNATDEDRAAYVEAAERVEDSLVSVWPSGTALSDFMGGSRGQDPFSAFIRHQEERVVLMATGGTLTSLASADTGALAVGAQMDVWREIVARDAVAADMGPLGEAVSAFLDAPSKEAAEALAARLPDLVPDDPATAAVIADAMAGAMGAAAPGTPLKRHEGRSET